MIFKQRRISIDFNKMKSSPGTINIAASAQRLDVDNCIALRYYFRISENILKQADIFRLEKNVIDLYVMLLRFSSLVSETIPCHREYRQWSQDNKLLLKKRLLNAVIELEQLKPAVQQKINELNRKHLDQMNGGYQNSSLALTPVKKQSLAYNNVNWVNKPVVLVTSYQNTKTQLFIPGRPEEQFRNLSLTAYRPKEETLSRHSIFAPSIDRRVQYPSNIDLTPVEIPRLLSPPTDDRHSIKEESSRPEEKKSSLISDVVVEDVVKVPQADEEPAMISFEEDTVQTNIIRQPSPPPVIAQVQDLVPAVSPQLADPTHGMDNSSCETYIASETPLEFHISTQMMESFMKVAKINTDRNLETCGILAGSLKNRKFYITALIIPKQESTSDSCQAMNEEEIFEVQDKRSLFPLGWIHTHPTQSCFMSSIDVHTHYSYQIMLPESVAIVMAPRDSTRKHGIFRLTTPGGMSVIRQCQQRGFHPHNSPPDGGPIYKTCTDVYMDPDIKFDVIDLG